MIEVIRGIVDGTQEEYLIRLLDLAKSDSIQEDEVVLKEDFNIDAQNIDLNEEEIKSIYVSLMFWNIFNDLDLQQNLMEHGLIGHGPRWDTVLKWVQNFLRYTVLHGFVDFWHVKVKSQMLFWWEIFFFARLT